MLRSQRFVSGVLLVVLMSGVVVGCHEKGVVVLKTAEGKRKLVNVGAGHRLMVAVREGDVEGVAKALKEGADLSTVDRWSKIQPLHMAARLGHGEIIGLLLKGGALVDQRSEAGLTAVMDAARLGQVASVKALIAGRANLLAYERKEKRTALDYAVKGGHDEVVKLLKAAGAE